jgi:hypothetical protein
MIRIELCKAYEGQRGKGGGSLWYCRRRGQLTVVSTGQGGPCLDLRHVSPSLAAAATATDLVVLEGMGRAVCPLSAPVDNFSCA